MFEYIEVTRLDAHAALDVLEQAQAAKRQAEVQEALAMLQVVRTYRHQIPTDKVRLGGEGTGLVDDFACLELAAALARSVDSVTQQVVELINLEARLPRLWETVVAGGVPLWLGRRLARITGELSLAKALWVDATIAPFTTRLGPARLLRFVEALVVQADPAAAESRWAAAARPRVEIGRLQRDGLRDLYGWLTAADAVFLDAALEQLSGILAAQGSTQAASERRATALGILATPARALAMIQHSLAQPALPGQQPAEPVETPENSGARSPFGCTGHHCGTISVDPDRLLPRATLVIHLSDDTLTTGAGIARCEQLGPLAIGQLRALLTNARVQVQPVFNPNGIAPVDSYEIPERIRRAVLLRHPFEVFPYGSYPSAGLDLDHTTPYRWDGARAQARSDNLGPLRRKTHRAKTHAGWRLSQPEPGRYTWISPLGRRYTVTSAGLTNNGRHSPGSNPWDDPLGGPLLPDPPTGSARRRRRSRRPIPVTPRRPRPTLRP